MLTKNECIMLPQEGNVNIGSQVANYGSYVSNCIAGLHIKIQVVSHEAKEEAASPTDSRLTP